MADVGAEAVVEDGASALRSSWREQAAAMLAWGTLVRFGAVALQAALVVAALRLWNVETDAFEKVATLALGGFVVHHFLPRGLRLPFFALLSMASVLVVFGLGAGSRLLAIGAVLIGLCHLPIPMRARIGAVLGAGVLLAVARAAPPWVPAPVRDLFPGAIWPILGSMFMFRLVLYIHELRHGTAPAGAARAAAYFFMLPNVCCPLFPVVDYQTLCRNHYNDDPTRIYQIGVKWMLRGLVQLMIYRLIYLNAMIDPAQAQDALDVGQYMLTTFLLYLKISGLFHLVIGMLHLFGFNLPETHHLYLLSSSFTDFWRRINIFWKDFITKTVFYPLYFRWRKQGDARAVVLATIIAFFATWLLHSYQWFWIRGRFPIVWSDLVFWLGLGVVVTLNVRWEQRRGRRRTLRKAARTLRSEVGLVLRTAATFVAICTLWTIWSTPSASELRGLARAAANASLSQVGVLLAVPLGLGALALLLGRRTREHTEGTRAQAVQASERFWPAAVRVGLGGAALVLVALRPGVLLPIEPRLLDVAKDLRERQLNTADEQALHRGYYEELGDVARFDNELWRMYGQAPPDWGHEMATMEKRADAIGYSYLPNISGRFKGAVLSTNGDGLRDKAYTREKPPGTFRAALLGASHDAGEGVPDGGTYESVAESLLASRLGFECLNFAASGYAPVQKLAVSEIRLPEYHPDVVLWAANRRELDWTFYGLERLVRLGLVRDYPFLLEAMAAEGIDAADGLPQLALERKLAARAPEVLEKILARFAAGTRARGAVPVLLLVEHPMDEERPAAFGELSSMATRAGMEVVDLWGAFSGIENRATLWIAPWDDHMNAQGHRLLGEKLAARLVAQGIVPAAPGP